jgi:alkylation response protein AidB-like acyl-CoA dehydrogenase
VARLIRKPQILQRLRDLGGIFLKEEMLARFASRAATYDKENRFFEEDFEDLRAAKYLLLPVPSEFGGAGMTLAEVCREQRRLAYLRARNCPGGEHARLLGWSGGRPLATRRYLHGMASA